MTDREATDEREKAWEKFAGESDAKSARPDLNETARLFQRPVFDAGYDAGLAAGAARSWPELQEDLAKAEAQVRAFTSLRAAAEALVNGAVSRLVERDGRRAHPGRPAVDLGLIYVEHHTAAREEIANLRAALQKPEEGGA